MSITDIELHHSILPIDLDVASIAECVAIKTRQKHWITHTTESAVKIVTDNLYSGNIIYRHSANSLCGRDRSWFDMYLAFAQPSTVVHTPPSAVIAVRGATNLVADEWIVWLRLPKKVAPINWFWSCSCNIEPWKYSRLSTQHNINHMLLMLSGGDRRLAAVVSCRKPSPRDDCLFERVGEDRAIEFW